MAERTEMPFLRDDSWGPTTHRVRGGGVGIPHGSGPSPKLHPPFSALRTEATESPQSLAAPPMKTTLSFRITVNEGHSRPLVSIKA